MHRITRERNSWFIIPLLRAAVNNVPLREDVWRPAAAAAQEVVRMLRPQLAAQRLQIAPQGYVDAHRQEAVIEQLDGATLLAMQNLYEAVTPRRA